MSPQRDENESRQMSRAEQLRQKRAEDARKQQTTMRKTMSTAAMPRVTSRSASTPVAPSRPVTVRGVTMGTVPVQQKVQSAPRRQYYYNLGATGAEMRLPAVPAIHLGWRLLSGMITLVALVAIIFLWTSPTFKISSLKINGLQRITESELISATGISNLTIFEVDPARLQKSLTNIFPELADLSVSTMLPATVNINARERTPILSWTAGDSVQWMDAEGYVFSARGETPAGLIGVIADDRVPMAKIVPAEAPSQDTEATETATPVQFSNTKVNPDIFTALLTLSQRMPAGTIFTYNVTEGIGWYDARGWQAFIGPNLNDLDQKMIVYDAVINQLNKQGVVPVMVSVRYVNAPYYRTEQ